MQTITALNVIGTLATAFLVGAGASTLIRSWIDRRRWRARLRQAHDAHFGGLEEPTPAIDYSHPPLALAAALRMAARTQRVRAVEPPRSSFAA